MINPMTPAPASGASSRTRKQRAGSNLGIPCSTVDDDPANFIDVIYLSEWRVAKATVDPAFGTAIDPDAPAWPVCLRSEFEPGAIA
jgi:hypothetical protein